MGSIWIRVEWSEGATYQADDMQHIVLLLLLASNGAILRKLVQQAGPLLTKQIGASQGAIAANNHQIGNAPLYQVVGGLQATRALTKVLATGGANDRAATVYNRRDRGPRCFLDTVTAIDHALVAFPDKVDLVSRSIDTKLNMNWM